MIHYIHHIIGDILICLLIVLAGWSCWYMSKESELAEFANKNCWGRHYGGAAREVNEYIKGRYQSMQPVQSRLP